MAGMNIRSMFRTWNEICALLGGGFIGIYILGMFTRRASGPGVIIGRPWERRRVRSAEPRSAMRRGGSVPTACSSSG